MQLLDFDLRAGFFQLLLGRVGVRLVRAFEHDLGRAFDQGFRFREAETGLHFAHRLDRRQSSFPPAPTPRTTSNVSFAAAAGAAAPPAAAPPAAATATGAAAETPHLVSSCFTRSAASRTVYSFNSSTRFCNVPILFFFLSSRRLPGSRAIFSSRPVNRQFTSCCFVCLFGFWPEQPGNFSSSSLRPFRTSP